MPLIEFREEGLYCPQADTHIDPWRAVKRAVITHGHADHAKTGSKYYLTHHDNLPVIRQWFGKSINAVGKEYGETVKVNRVRFFTSCRSYFRFFEG